MSGRPTSFLAVGEKAPNVAFRNSSAHELFLGDLVAHQAVLLVFFKVSCPVCQRTLPFLERVRENGQVRVVGVSQDDVESTQEFLREFSPGIETVYDPSPYPASQAFRITHVPTIFLIEPGGAISHAWSGFSKRDLTVFGERVGQRVFRESDHVPEFQPG
ncbi:MAG: TlpA family protein disulfide reductase [Bryobacteraceae bacterium]|nr:TlpA family protein disulfide reductase [Bryobacteraceae bacterium]MDW8376567.1 TlpA disulfide reductase family protein [Bryobacterales bacterium]